MSEDVEDTSNLMPTERKSIWRTAEERRMSDLTRVLEWLERRQSKQKRAIQVCTLEDIAGRIYARLLTRKRVEFQHLQTKGHHFFKHEWESPRGERSPTTVRQSLFPSGRWHDWAPPLPPKTGLQSFLVIIF